MSPDAFASSKVASNLLNCITFGKVRDESGGVGGTVPATLSLTLGGAASFGAFAPGVARDYTASTTANVISTAGDATLTHSDPGHLTNGAFSLRAAAAGVAVEVDLERAGLQRPGDGRLQAVDRRQRARCAPGTYSKTLTFTLSTTTP